MEAVYLFVESYCNHSNIQLQIFVEQYHNFTLAKYVDAVAAKSPVPGGGSVAALTAATATALITMVAQYSLGKSSSKNIDKNIRKILKRSDQLRRRLLELVDLDAQAYLDVVAARNAPTPQRKAALRKAAQIPKEVCRCCYAAIQLTPFLVTQGNKNLISDIEVAVELLFASFKSATIMMMTNQ